MYCTRCGFQLDEAHQFCPKCGQPARPGSPAARLSRPMDQKMFTGVCAGFARSAGMDVTLMRILWIVATVLTGGLAVLVYIGAWIAMPKDYPPAHAA
jgi:phage shock protein C